MNKTSVFCSTTLESNTCSRCGGDGKLWQFTSVFGGVCFKCRGNKKILTKRGRAANDYLVKLRSVRADALAVGMLIREETMTSPCNFVTCFMRITSIRPMTAEDVAGCYTTTNGVKVPHPHEGRLKVEMTNKKYGGLGTEYACDKLVRVACTAEFKNATLRQALAYQSTLTKSGKETRATSDFLNSFPSSKLPANPNPAPTVENFPVLQHA